MMMITLDDDDDDHHDDVVGYEEGLVFSRLFMKLFIEELFSCPSSAFEKYQGILKHLKHLKASF